MLLCRQTIINPQLGGGSRHRIEYIDSLKGFSILCVVLGHVVNGYLNAGLYPEATTLMYGIYNLIYAFHMPLFFMISGFVYRKAYFDESGHVRRVQMKRQCTNLLCNYITFSLIWAMSKMLFAHWVNSDITFQDIAMIWCKPIDLYWYMYDLVIFYLIFSLNKIRKVSGMIITGSLLIASCLSGFVSVQWFDMMNLCHYAFFFYLGMNIPFLLIKKEKRNMMLSVIFCMALVLLVALDTFVATGICFLLWQLFQNVRLLSGNRILIMLGRHSLEIYLVHNFFTAMFRALFQWMGIDHVIMNVFLNTVLSTMLPLVVSFICVRIGLDTLFFRPAYLMKWDLDKRSE